jgi:hypothetical protein
MLKLVSEPSTLREFVLNEAHGEGYAGLSEAESDALKNGDIHKLREMLYREAYRATNNADSRSRLASDYTVSISGDTPHIPITLNSSLSYTAKGRELESLWSAEGLTIVGTGIRGGLQTTPESLFYIKNASRVLFLVADVLSQLWIKSLNPKAESLQGFYRKDTYRLDIYNDIVSKILEELREHRNLCVVFYGHPGCFVYPAYEAIRLARSEGFHARMFPGVSAADNLYADLGIDPGLNGIQSYEATNFVLCRYSFDTSVGLILWQIGLFGYAYWDPEYKSSAARLKIFVEYMADYYDLNHEVVLYEASEVPLGNARVVRLPLSALPNSPLPGVATLYVPPRSRPAPDLDLARRLGIKIERE